MALVYADRVQETSTTTGTGTYDLAGAVTGFRTFVAGIATANTCYYCATDGTSWEVGYGTVTDAATDTLTRTKVRQSSNSNNPVSWAAGVKTIFCTIPAHMAMGGMPGSIIESGVTSAPFGYLALGTDALRTDYPELFDAIGTGYGASDGSHFYAGLSKAGRVTVGAGTGTVTETQPAANFATTDIITVNSNPMATIPKWLTGMIVRATTSGVLPTGIAAATDHYVSRINATTIYLYDTLVNAMAGGTTGRRDITNIGSGNHTLTCTLTARALADLFGTEINGALPSHSHPLLSWTSAAASGGNTGVGASSQTNTNLAGSTEGITNMPPSIVSHFYMKY